MKRDNIQGEDWEGIKMHKQYSFAAYILIGFGIYFLFNELNVLLVKDINFTTAILFIIGFSILLHSFKTKQSELIISGMFTTGMAIHFYCLSAIPNWKDHWAVYILIIGIALLFNFFKTKQGLFVSLIVILISLLFILSNKINNLFKSFFDLFGMGTTYWPLIFIGIGFFLLRTKK